MIGSKELKKKSSRQWIYSDVSLIKCAEIPESKWERERVLNIIKWVLKGLNEKFIKEADQYTNINDIKDCYMEELRKYVEILKKGLYY